MAGRVYSDILLHFTWHTKSNAPMLRGKVEDCLCRNLRGRILQTPGVFLHEFNIVDDHLHFAAQVPPTLNVSEWIGKLKGGSSHDVNKELGRRVLEWQEGFGAVSFSRKGLQFVCEYIRRQREHHARGTLIEYLERVSPPQAEANEERPLIGGPQLCCGHFIPNDLKRGSCAPQGYELRPRS